MLDRALALSHGDRIRIALTIPATPATTPPAGKIARSPALLSDARTLLGDIVRGLKLLDLEIFGPWRHYGLPAW
jgi:hypothetical protein